MPIQTLIKTSEYHDSVSLMLAARELLRLPGVADAAVVMGTEANKGLLREAGLLTSEAALAAPNDLVISVSASTPELAGQALEEAQKILRKKPAPSASDGSPASYRPRTLASANRADPSTNLAVISVGGRYATAEAWDALHRGLHVLLFSDNVSLADEIALKRHAVDHGLLMMGPGAGTAILNGVALGFANRLPTGPVGIVSAAGTGLQEVSTLLARQGVGLSQGIGTGGRDLKEEVGGLMMLAGLRALQADPATQVIVLVSKPPAPQVAEKVLEQASAASKPVVVCFLGQSPDQAGRIIQTYPGLRLARTLEEAADLAAGEPVLPGALGLARPARPAPPPPFPCPHFQPQQRYLRALFSGGTLCYEAQVVWRDGLKEPVYSNAPLDPACLLPDSHRSQRHTAVDLGEEEFTVGRPHPMLDNDLRLRRILQEARDPETAVILFDVVLGFGAHPDPASELGPAVEHARRQAAEAGREIAFIASVTGIENDPQVRSRQVGSLEASGVVVCESNAAAARLAGALVTRL